jgi:carbonic anhydrase
MCSLDTLFANNRAWANQRVAQDAEFFTRLAAQQSPRYLWIGCSDSRVSVQANRFVDARKVAMLRRFACELQKRQIAIWVHMQDT